MKECKEIMINMLRNSRFLINTLWKVRRKNNEELREQQLINIFYGWYIYRNISLSLKYLYFPI